MKRPKRFKTTGKKRGQALVEFAIILPVFFLVVAGMFDLGLGVYSDLTLVNAAREGARLGVIDQRPPQHRLVHAASHRCPGPRSACPPDRPVRGGDRHRPRISGRVLDHLRDRATPHNPLRRPIRGQPFDDQLVGNLALREVIGSAAAYLLIFNGARVALAGTHPGRGHARIDSV